MMLAQASEVQMLKWLKARLGWADEPGHVWFRCQQCGEGFTAPGLDQAPVHSSDTDGVNCGGIGKRTRTPGHRA